MGLFDKFKLKGNRQHLRTDMEMNSLDKKEADEAFKKYKKELIDPLLKEYGFLKYKTNSYVRRNKVDVLEYVDLQKEQHGSKTFTVNCALTPLYVPHDFFCFDISIRIGKLICNKDIWWDYGNVKIAKTGFENVADAIETYAFPWFEAHSTNEAIKEFLIEEKNRREKLSNNQEAWLVAINNRDNNCSVIADNVKLFSLPKNF